MKMKNHTDYGAIFHFCVMSISRILSHHAVAYAKADKDKYLSSPLITLGVKRHPMSR